MDKLAATQKAIQKAGGLKAVSERVALMTGEDEHKAYQRVKKWNQRGVVSTFAIPLEQWSGISRCFLSPEHYPMSEYGKTG